jgi:lipopolysaccharide transport system ATP-binding protein
MDEPAITVEGVSKRYRLGSVRHTTLKESLGSVARTPARLLGRGGHRPSRRVEEIWALSDVSLDVSRGEVVGLVGANGAGKSTLLKLLSRVTLPDAGRITLNGRVGTLLEVGTGFHPELTGRENAFLSGAILGMRRLEIARKLDDIVAFAGVEEFIDTPVKRYSSGMFVRLAFAVAAFLEPEILLVDEVLSVGDAKFQRRCLGRMNEVAEEGRTVVFVSHNLSAVQRLCPRSFWLHHGRLVAAGPSSDVIASYLREAGARQGGGRATIGDEVSRSGTGAAQLRHATLLGGEGEPVDRICLGEPIALELAFEVTEPIDDAVVEIGIVSSDGVRVVTAQSIDRNGALIEFERGTNEVRAELDITLLPGEYSVDIAVHRLVALTLDQVERVLTFSAINASYDGSHNYPWNVVKGSVRPPSRWFASGKVASPSSAA